ncbi:uncharacterized protein ISCGN_007140 [Ixodes scapularis]
MLQRLEFPFDTNCVDYRRMETMTHYPSFYTQEICFSECARNLTKKHCGCTLRDYPFRNFLSEPWCDREKLECASRLRQSYEKVCSSRCRVPCSETTYDARPVKSEVTVPVLENGGYYSTSIKFSMSSRTVDVLLYIEKLQITQILALLGGYLGVWLGLSLQSLAFTVISTLLRRLQLRQRSKYRAAEVSTLMRCLGLVATLICLSFCVMNSLEDVNRYWSFPAAVVYSEDRRVEFPGVTICIPQGYNRTKLLTENDLDPNGIDGEIGEQTFALKPELLKHLINYSFSPDSMIIDCQMSTTSDVCRSFPCRKL